MTPTGYLLDASERRTVVELLMPWKGYFHFHAYLPSFFDALEDDEEIVLQVAIKCPDVDTSANDSRPEFWQLRRAVDLLQLMIALDPTLTKELGVCRWVSMNHITDEVCNSLEKGQRTCSLQVYFEIDAHGVVDECFTTSPPVSDSNQYEAAHRELTSRIMVARGPQWVDALPPVCLVVDVHRNSMNVCRGETLESEILRIKQFAKALRESRASFTAKVRLELKWPLISSSLVKLFEDLANMGVPLETLGMNLDPYDITCSGDELGKLLAMTFSTSSELHVTVSGSPKRSTSNRRSVFEVLATYPNISTVMIEGCFDEDEVVLETWEPLLLDLFDTLLSRSSVEKILVDCVGLDRLGTASHAKLQSLVTEWKEANPSKTLRCRHFDVKRIGSSPSRALAMALDEVERVYVRRHTGDPSVIATMVHNFRGLKSVMLVQVVVATMDLFTKSALPILNVLKLVEVELQDSTSLRRFFNRLAWRHDEGDWELGVLYLNGGGLDLDGESAALLHEMLKTNRFLYDVNCMITKTVDKKSEVQALLQSHYQDAVYAPAEARNSIKAKTQRCAFLSAIYSTTSSVADVGRRLDSFLVRKIFRFSAQRTWRRMSIS